MHYCVMCTSFFIHSYTPRRIQPGKHNGTHLRRWDKWNEYISHPMPCHGNIALFLFISPWWEASSRTKQKWIDYRKLHGNCWIVELLSWFTYIHNAMYIVYAPWDLFQFLVYEYFNNGCLGIIVYHVIHPIYHHKSSGTAGGIDCRVAPQELTQAWSESDEAVTFLTRRLEWNAGSFSSELGSNWSDDVNPRLPIAIQGSGYASTILRDK